MDRDKKHLEAIKTCIDDCILYKIENQSIRNKIPQTIKNFFSQRINSPNGMLDISYHKYQDLQKIIDQRIMNNYYDCIYTDSAMASYVGNSELPKIVEPLDINYKNWYAQFKMSKTIKKRTYWIIRTIQSLYKTMFVYRKFNYCTVVTYKDKKEIDEFLSNLVVIPNGVDINYFRPREQRSKDDLSIIYTGDMSGRKNIETVMYFYEQIFPKIKSEKPNVKFYVVGGNPPSSIKALKEEKNIFVTGFVEDIRKYLALSDIFICPMISGTGIKNKVLEAMAMGKPVVSTRIGALGIEAEHKREILIADDPEDFANCVISLLNNYEKRIKIGESGRKLIEEEYSWEKCAERVENLFLRIINNK